MCFGSRCSKEYIIWLGGEHGSIMRPGIVDFGVNKQVFFNDLSCRRTDTVEYQLAKRILSDMKPMSMVLKPLPIWRSLRKSTASVLTSCWFTYVNTAT